MKKPEEYYEGIYDLDTNGLINRLATIFADIGDEWRPDLTGLDEDTRQIAFMHDAIVSSIDLISCHFSQLNAKSIDDVIDFPDPVKNRRRATKESIMQHLNEIFPVLHVASIISSNIQSRNIQEMHEKGIIITDEMITRTQKIFNIAPVVTSFIYMILSMRISNPLME